MGIRSLFLAVILVTVLVMKDAHISSSAAAAFAVGYFIEEEEEEFMMDSEVNRRVLQDGNEKIGYDNLRRSSFNCNSKIYGIELHSSNQWRPIAAL